MWTWVLSLICLKGERLYKILGMDRVNILNFKRKIHVSEVSVIYIPCSKKQKRLYKATASLGNSCHQSIIQTLMFYSGHSRKCAVFFIISILVFDLTNTLLFKNSNFLPPTVMQHACSLLGAKPTVFRFSWGMRRSGHDFINHPPASDSTHFISSCLLLLSGCVCPGLSQRVANQE